MYIGKYKVVGQSRIQQRFPFDKPFTFSPPIEVQNKLFEIGLWEGLDNDVLDSKPTNEEVIKIGELLEPHYGYFNAVCIWYNKPIEQWRIVFGIERD